MASTHPEELFIALLRSAYGHACHGVARRRPTAAPGKLPAVGRGLSYLASDRARLVQPVRMQRLAAINGRWRSYSTLEQQQKTNPPRQIAVLGGGITGLTAAHYLARHAPDAHITLYEASDRLGGWIDGKPTRVADGEDAEVMMQRGPRMLRSGATSNKYDDLVLYDVVSTRSPAIPLYSLTDTDFVSPACEPEAARPDNISKRRRRDALYLLPRSSGPIAKRGALV